MFCLWYLPSQDKIVALWTAHNLGDKCFFFLLFQKKSLIFNEIETPLNNINACKLHLTAGGVGMFWSISWRPSSLYVKHNVNGDKNLQTHSISNNRSIICIFRSNSHLPRPYDKWKLRLWNFHHPKVSSTTNRSWCFDGIQFLTQTTRYSVVQLSLISCVWLFLALAQLVLGTNIKRLSKQCKGFLDIHMSSNMIAVM